jgi:hypothetical protein
MPKKPKSQITTIKLDKSIKNRLDNLKESEKETYNETIEKAINILNICLNKPLLANKILRDIEHNKKRREVIFSSGKSPKEKNLMQKDYEQTGVIEMLEDNMQKNMQRVKKNVTG